MKKTPIWWRLAPGREWPLELSYKVISLHPCHKNKSSVTSHASPLVLHVPQETGFSLHPHTLCVVACTCTEYKCSRLTKFPTSSCTTPLRFQYSPPLPLPPHHHLSYCIQLHGSLSISFVIIVVSSSLSRRLVESYIAPPSPPLIVQFESIYNE